MMLQYMSKIGRNVSGELFHPDEILAQNFVIAAAEPSLDLLQKIRASAWQNEQSRCEEFRLAHRKPVRCTLADLFDAIGMSGAVKR